MKRVSSIVDKFVKNEHERILVFIFSVIGIILKSNNLNEFSVDDIFYRMKSSYGLSAVFSMSLSTSAR